MAGWVCYTKKIVSSALTSIAGELEQTAQDFNDAFQNLSRPTASTRLEHTTQTVVLSNCESTQGEAPKCISDDEAHGIIYRDRPGNIETLKEPKLKASRSSHSLKNVHKDKKDKNSRSTHSHRSQKQISSESLSRGCSNNTATTSQPQPSTATPLFPTLHSRLSQSSPSLTDHSGNSSDAEEDKFSPHPLFPDQHNNPDFLHSNATRPKAVKANTVGPLTFSLSTPCLIHAHKILPSCKRNFNCPSISKDSVNLDKSSTKIHLSKHQISSTLSTKEAIHSASMRFPALAKRSAGVRKTVNIGCRFSRSTSSQVAPTKPPGKVVVVSQPPSIEDIHQESQSTESTGWLNDNMSQSKEEQLKTGESQSASEAQLLLNEVNQTSYALEETENRSGSPQDQLVIRTVKSSIQVERDSPRWPVLAPLTRAINFAFTQMVNAILLLQEEENSVASGNPRSYASSICRDGDVEVVLSNRSTPTSCDEGAEQDQTPCESNKLGSFHRRQMSQLSFAGSTFSSESFEILDAGVDIDNANFVYIGDDASRSDILQEYHLFPSKPEPNSISPSITHPDTSSMVLSDVPSKTTVTSIPFPNSGADPMSSSSADFAHFDFGELIANRHHNQLNPMSISPRNESTSPADVDTLRDEESLSEFYHVAESIEPEESMYESFVILEGGNTAAL